MTDPHSLLVEEQGWQAHLNLGFEKRAGKTVLAQRTQTGPLSVQRPFYPEGQVCHLYLLHPPGGVVGGDELHINITAKKQSNVLITTPGATKFYRNNGIMAKQIQTLVVEDECSLEWFPQENIFFNETHSLQSTRIELENTACFIGWEINCYGRPAADALFKAGSVVTSFELYRNGTPLLLDRLRIVDRQALQSPLSLAMYPCFGTLVASNATQELLDNARQSIAEINTDQQIGITLMDDILVARCLGQSAEQITTSLKLIWTVLRPEIIGRDACNPRIWST